MRTQHFTARVGNDVSIAEDVTYGELLERVLEFVVRAAIAKASDRCNWEEEELRREGLKAIEFAKDGKALWWERDAFEAGKYEAKRARVQERFVAQNVLEETFLKTLDADVRKRLRLAGYASSSLIDDMHELYAQVAADASDRSAQAREGLVAEILGS